MMVWRSKEAFPPVRGSFTEFTGDGVQLDRHRIPISEVRVKTILDEGGVCDQTSFWTGKCC